MKRGKPLRRKAAMRGKSKRSAHSKGHLFPKNVDQKRRAFIRTFPCEIALAPGFNGGGAQIDTHFCHGAVECAHIKSRGSGGLDAGNMIPLCHAAADQQGLIGWRTFERRWRIDARKRAASYESYYIATRGEG